MKSILKLTALAAVLLMLAACKNKEEKHPIEIPFKEPFTVLWLKDWPRRNLPGELPCLSRNLNFRGMASAGELIIIRNYADLAKYIICEDNQFLAIDFSKYTLLLTYGVTPRNIYGIEKITFFMML